MGIFSYRDASRAREHVQALRKLGWTYEGIQQACGVSSGQACALARGLTRYARADTEQRILSMPLERADSYRGIDHIGTTRRLQALQWMGWPAREVAALVGSTEKTIATVKIRGGLSHHLAARIADVYRQISHVPGSSRIAATKARKAGYPPPAAWDDEKIDDPKARFFGTLRMKVGG